MPFQPRPTAGLPLKQHFYRIALGLIATAVIAGHTAHFLHVGFLSRLDAILYDAALRLTMPRTRDTRIVITDIDEKSLAELGRWPWSRDRLATLVTKIFERYGATLLGLDVILAEPDTSSGIRVLDSLARGALKEERRFRTALDRLRPELDYDRRFAEVLRKYPVILGYHFSHGEKAGSSGALPQPVLSPDAFVGHNVGLTVWQRYSGNLKMLQDAAFGAGYNNGVPDFDGVSRRAPLIVSSDGGYYEALSLALARAVVGKSRPVPRFAAGSWSARIGASTLEYLDLPTTQGTLKIPVDARAMALIPYRGEQGSYLYHSAADLLADRLPSGTLRGKIVLLGTTAPGLLDLRSTPVGEAYPGVEVHANLLSGILDGRLKATPAYMVGLETSLILLVGAIMVLFLPSRSPVRAMASSAAILAAAIGCAAALWQWADIVMPVASVTMLILTVNSINMSFGYFRESHAKRSMTRLFGQYVPPELVREMSRNPDHYGMEGRNAELSVLFADIRGFTALSEGLAPQDLATLMNEFFTAMTSVISGHRGTLDKYIGDAIMAFWGAPVDDPQHAQHAVAAALQMHRKLREVNEAFAARDWPSLAIGIGINTGAMTVGDMGSRERKAYTVVGDAVNIASRFEGLTAHYGVGIIVGEATRSRVDGIVLRELDRVRVRGSTRALVLFEPVGLEGEVSPALRAELEDWHAALLHYRTGEWDVAVTQLQILAAAWPERHIYTLFLERIAAMRLLDSAQAWDGVWSFAKK